MPLLTARMLHDDEPHYVLPQAIFSVLFLKAYLNAVRSSSEPPTLLSVHVQGSAETCLDTTFLGDLTASLLAAVRKGDLIGVLRSGVETGRTPRIVATGKSEPVSESDKAAGSPVSEVERLDEVKALISLGKEKGFLTYEELDNALPPDVLSSEQLEHLMVIFGEQDIEVVRSGEGERFPPLRAAKAETSWKGREKKSTGYFTFGVLVPRHTGPATTLMRRIRDRVAPLLSTSGIHLQLHADSSHDLYEQTPRTIAELVVMAMCHSSAGVLPEKALRYFLGGECSNAKRDSSLFSIVVLKLDSPHTPADTMRLADITGSLSGSLRGGDVLGTLQQDKLIVYLPAAEAMAALWRANAICRRLERYIGKVTVLRSLCFPEDAPDADELLALAEIE